MNAAAVIAPTPGTLISRRISSQAQGLGSDHLLDRGDLGLAELDLAHRAVDRLALGRRQRELGQPLAAGLAEEVAEAGLRDEPPHQRRVDLVLGRGSGADELASALKPPAHRLRRLVGDPDRLELAGGKQPGQGPGVEAVGLGAGLAHAGVGGAHGDDASDVGAQDPHHLPGVAAHLQGHLVTAVKARSEELEALDVHRHPGAGADLTSRGDRDLHAVAVDVDADRSHLPPPMTRIELGGEAVDKRHRRIRAQGPTGRVAGAAIEKAGSKPIAQIGLSSLRLSTKAPVPVART